MRNRPTYTACIICGIAINGLRNSPYCVECKSFAEKFRFNVCRKVKRAVERGDMPAPSTLVCVDCGNVAKFYDHRDYAKPFDVAPVCHGCNVLRGPGKYPEIPRA